MSHPPPPPWKCSDGAGGTLCSWSMTRHQRSPSKTPLTVSPTFMAALPLATTAPPQAVKKTARLTLATSSIDLFLNAACSPPAHRALKANSPSSLQDLAAELE